MARGQILRPYQERALSQLRLRFAAGKRRVLLVAPMGSGKTTVASAIMRGAEAKGSHVLFLAHRQELVFQCVARLAEHGIRAGVIMAKHAPSEAHVQVASIQTLVRRKLPPANLIIIDECHHARARTYRRVLNAYPSAPVIGLTATPWRTDGKGLGELFDSIVIAARPRELVDAGYLCPVSGFAYDAPELAGVRSKAGDYDEDEAAEAMGYVGGNIVQRWLDTRPGRTVLFACSVAHSQRLAAAFAERGVAAEHLDGTTPSDERAAILARLAAGSTDVVCNVAVLGEGWDLPALRCVILARPTKSLGAYLQQAGRGLRPADGKTVARIHDHAGNTFRHGLVDEDRDYSLAGDTKRDLDPVAATKTCPTCYAVFRPAPRCPSCGEDLPAASEPRPLREVAGVELTLEQAAGRRYVPAAQARPAYEALAREGQEKGYKPGWAAVRFHARFGFWPRSEWCAPFAAPPPAAATANAELRLISGVDAARRAWLDARAREPADYENTERMCGTPS